MSSIGNSAADDGVHRHPVPLLAADLEGPPDHHAMSTPRPRRLRSAESGIGPAVLEAPPQRLLESGSFPAVRRSSQASPARAVLGRW